MLKSTQLERSQDSPQSLTPEPVVLMARPGCCSDGLRFALTSDQGDSFLPIGPGESGSYHEYGYSFLIPVFPSLDQSGSCCVNIRRSMLREGTMFVLFINVYSVPSTASGT